MRSLAQDGDTRRSALIGAIEALAEHLGAHGKAALSSVVEDTFRGEAERVPQRFLAQFTRGIGGLLDAPLCTDGHVDP